VVQALEARGQTADGLGKTGARWLRPGFLV